MQKLTLLLITTLAVGTEIQAQDTPPSTTPAAPTGKVRVVTRDVEPFSFDQDGRRVGFSMDLWDAVAKEAKLDYEMTVVPGPPQALIDALTNKTADVAIAAITVTSKREAIIDFSQPFYESGLQIMVMGSSGSFGDSMWGLISGLFSLKLIAMFAVLILAILIISHMIWVYEHKVNDEEWPAQYRHGLWESCWWTISALLVGGAENKGPRSVGGRIFAIIWMLLSIVLVSLLTASFTTTLTVSSLKGGINGPGDLPGKKVATIGASSVEKWLTAHEAKVQPFKTLTECIEALKKGDADAVVYDAPMIQFTLNKIKDDKLQLAGPVFDRQNYAIGLQQDSALRERINQALLALYEGGIRTELRKKWFGEEE